MKKSDLGMWILLLLIASMPLSVVMIGPVGAQSTTIGVEPDSIVDPGLGIGSTFTVEIWIRDVEDLAGIEFKLGYDATVLNATLIEYGGIYEPNAYLQWINKINEAEGWLYYSISRFFGEPSFYGDGRAAIINFTVLSVGASALDLYGIKLGDSTSAPMGPLPIVHAALDGYFRNALQVHDIAVTSVTVSPTEVTVGENVTIKVTVGNEGDLNETFNVIVYADIIAYDPFDPDIVLVGDEITVGTMVDITLYVGANTTVSFTWDTTGVLRGTYTISANTTVVEGETDTVDNILIDGKVAVLVHDIAVTSVTVSPTEVTVGENVTIKVTVRNEGGLNETFNVIVYYDDIAIETETGIFLRSGNSIILTFTWNTTDVAGGTYTIKAEASVVPDEIDTADNAFPDGTVKVRGETRAPNILPYAAAGIVIIIAAAIAIYIIKFRR